jgi:hypothetical protein
MATEVRIVMASCTSIIIKQGLLIKVAVGLRRGGLTLLPDSKSAILPREFKATITEANSSHLNTTTSTLSIKREKSRYKRRVSENKRKRKGITEEIRIRRKKDDRLGTATASQRRLLRNIRARQPQKWNGSTSLGHFSNVGNETPRRPRECGD